MNPPNHPSLARAVLLLGALLPGLALAHAERTSFFPAERVSQQPVYRPLLPAPQEIRLVVCKREGDEGVTAGDDSASRIERIEDAALRAVNLKLLGECAFEHLQAAVDAVHVRGTTIYVLPGLYREQPSIRALDENAGASNPADKTFCEAVLARGDGRLSYEEQVRCRHIQNTVAIFGDPNFTDDNCGNNTEGVCANPQTQACNPAQSACQYYDLQIEGTGEKPVDVIFEGDFVTKPGDPSDGHFRYLNGIRADRADGIYLRNFTTQIYEFNAVYALETDGFVFDRLLSRWVDEYAYLSFACDHALYDTVDGYGAADSVVYPGSGADIYKTATHANADLRARQGTEVRNSTGRHAAGGYSGTAGNSPWVHDSRFFKNQTGLATESIFGGHPGMPQDHGLFENNLIYNNNKNYFAFVEEDGPCIVQTPRDRGLVPPEFREFDTLPPEVQEAILDRMVLCPGIPFPTGAGMVIGGGNYDVAQNNQMFDNWRYGFMLFHVPTALRYTESDPDEYALANPYDNSYFDRFLNNQFAGNLLFSPPLLQPNTNDFWFDNSGLGHCFDGNVSLAGAISADTGDPLRPLPGGPCTDGPVPDSATQTASAQNDRIAFLASCIAYDRTNPATKSPECPFFDPLVAPANRQNVAEALNSRPVENRLRVGEGGKAGYFVLNNDSGNTHQLASVTIAAGGPVEYLPSGLTLSVKLAQDGQIVTHTARLASTSGSNVFTFAEPVPLPPVNYLLFELQADGPDVVALGDRVLLASGASGALGLVLLVLGGAAQRRWLALVLALTATGTLTSCGSSTPIGGGPIVFQLQALDVTDPNGAVAYQGLPLNMGSISLH